MPNLKPYKTETDSIVRTNKPHIDWELLTEKDYNILLLEKVEEDLANREIFNQDTSENFNNKIKEIVDQVLIDEGLKAINVVK